MGEPLVNLGRFSPGQSAMIFGGIREIDILDILGIS